MSSVIFLFAEINAQARRLLSFSNRTAKLILPLNTFDTKALDAPAVCGSSMGSLTVRSVELARGALAQQGAKV